MGSMIKHKLLNKQGFTLIEVVVIVALLAILSSMVFIGYSSYKESAIKAQIQTTADAYQSSLKAYASETEKFPTQPFCMPAGSKCCYTLQTATSTVRCGTDANSGWTAGSQIAAVGKHIRNPAPEMPVFSTFQNCSATLTSTGGPCKSTATVKAGITYMPTTTGVGTSTAWSAEAKTKGVLIYFVPSQYSCYSNDVIRLGNTNSLMYTTDHQLYTDHVEFTGYRQCIIGLRIQTVAPVPLT